MRRLKLLSGLLLVITATFFATTSVRQRALLGAERIRRETAEGERLVREERQARRKRVERQQLLEKLVRDPENVDHLLATAALYGQDRRYDDAIFLLQEARRLAPDSVEPYRALYQTYISQSQFDRAYDHAREGLKRAPRDLELILGLVHLDTLVGWNSEARSLLRQLEGTPQSKNPRVRIASALVYRQVTDSRHAEADLRAAVEQDPRNDKIYALLSGVQWEAGKGRAAEDSIRKAIALQPRNPDYLLHLSEIQLRETMPIPAAAARQTAERALEADPGNRNAFFAIAQALLAEKRTAEATDILERLLRRHPDHQQASHALARIYLQQGRQGEAQPLLKQYAEGIRQADALKSLTLKVAMLPNSAAAHLELGKLYNETGSPEKAVLVLRRSLQLKPREPKARRQLARALAGTGRSGEYAELADQPGWHVVDVLQTGS